jgi:hypothetical protein
MSSAPPDRSTITFAVALQLDMPGICLIVAGVPHAAMTTSHIFMPMSPSADCRPFRDYQRDSSDAFYDYCATCKSGRAGCPPTFLTTTVPPTPPRPAASRAVARRRRVGAVKQRIRQQIPDWLQVDLLIIVEAISIIGAGIFIAP